MDRAILITGGAGFIGSHLAEEVLKKYPNKKLVILDDLSTGKIANLPKNKRLVFVKGSITDKALMAQLFNAHSFGLVFHLAAVASVQKSVEEPTHTHAINFDATLHLLKLSKKHGVKKLTFASSAAVYGDLPELPKKEDMPIKPLTPYAVDKYAAERYFLNAYRLYGLKTTALRFFNVFGERQDSASSYSGVLSIFVNRIKRFQNGEDVSITIYGDGTQTRDFIYVKDVVQALILAAEQDKADGQVFNVGLGKSTSLLEILGILEGLTGKLPPIKFLPARPGDIKHSQADITKLKTLGFSPKYSLTEGLKRLLIFEGVRLKS